MFKKATLRLTNYALSNMISVRNYTPRRALMYVPGDDLKKINKAFTLDVDCIALDCEDGVAVNKKEQARNTIKAFLEEHGKPKTKRDYDLGVRINSADTSFCRDDISAILSCKNLPDTILLPKVETVTDIKWFSSEVNRLLKNDRKVNLIIFIETAKGFINLVDICKIAQEMSQNSNFVLTSLVFGSDDLCASIGATRTEESLEIIYARQKLLLTAKAFNLQAIDMVYIKYKDLEGLRKQSEEGMRMGYTGKQVIHPGQVPVVQEAFLPSPSQIEWADGLLKSFEEHQINGKGAFTYKGSMIDMPTMKQAKNIQKLASLSRKE